MKRGFLTGLLGTVALFAAIETPCAQQSVQIVQKICNTNSGPTQCSYVPVSTSAPLNIQGAVTGTFSATLGGFTPASSPRMTPLSVTVGGATQALPAAATAGAVLVVQNTDSTNPIFCNVNEAAPTVADQEIPANSWFAFTLPSPAPTDLECIATGGTVVANGTVGAGLPTGAGGGGGSGGSGGAITAPLGHGTADASAVSIVPSATASFPVTGTFWQATQPVSGTVAATQSGTWNVTNVSGTVSLPTGASTSALQTTGNTALTTINTTLGSPFQAGGSIGNTAFNVTTGGNAVSATHPLATEVVDASGNIVATTSNNLNVQCANCSGSGASATDGASFTAGSSVFGPVGGVYQSGGVTTNPIASGGKQGLAQLTQYRALMTDWYNSSGTEMGTSGSPVQVSLANTGANGTAILVTGTGGTFTVSQPTAASLNATVVQGTAANLLTQVSQPTASSLNATVVQGTAGNLNATVVGTGTFATQSAITAASGALASGALAAGSISSGAAVSGAFATGAIADLALAQGSTSSGQKANMVLGAATTSAPTDTTGNSWPLSLTTTGGLRSDMSTIAGTTTLTGTGAVGTGAQRIAVGTDTATIAGSAPGTAGSASANVLSVQGVASMTALLANPGTIATWGLMSGTTSGSAPTNTQIVGAIYNSAAPTPSTGQTLPLQLDSSGNLDVNIKAGAGGGTASSFGSTFPSTGTAAGAEYLSSPPSLTTGQMVALQTTSAGSLHTTVDNTNANGSATSANSSPVVIASDQAAVAVKGTADNTSFTANTTPTVDIGGLYQTTATTNPLSAGNSGMAQLTHYRALQTDWYNSSGTEMGTSGSPVQVSLANTTSNGTAVLVTGTGGTFPAALNGTPTLANGNGVVPTQGGAVLSATNGEFANILQGNAVLASGNPLFAQLTTGSATIGALVANQSVNAAQVNGVTTLTGAGATGTGSIRDTVAQDTTTIAGSAPGTAGSASANVVTVQGVASMTPVQTSPTAYPASAVPITASATGTTGATTATLTNVTAHTTYICGFSIRANATAAATGNATVTGTITGTMNYTQWTAPNASGLGVTEEVFSPCVPASAVSTSIAVVSAAPGTGGVVSVTAWGFSI